MKLLLDEMHTSAIARALREKQLDIVAVTELPNLRGAPDVDVLRYATDDGRAVVTENVRDFASLAQQWAASGVVHGGVIFTNPGRFNRARTAYPGDLLDALRQLAQTSPVAPGEVRWL